MTEKEKKYQVFKIATELNISKEHIIEFLKSINVEVKSAGSKVSEEVYEQILEKFKKEKAQAEKIQEKAEKFKTKKEEQKPKEKKPAFVGISSKKKVKQEKEISDVKEELEQTVSEVPELEPTESIISVEVEPESISKVEELVSKQEELIPIEDKVEEKKEDIPQEKHEEAEPKDRPENIETTQLVIQEPPQTEALDKQEHVETKEVESERARTSLDQIKSNFKGPKVVGKIKLDEEAESTGPEVQEQKVELEEKREKEKPAKKKKKPKKKQLRDEIKKKKAIEEESEKPKKQKKGKIREFINEKEIDEAIKKTLIAMDDSALAQRAAIKRKKKKEKLEELKRQEEILEKEKSILRVTEFITVGELANMMNVPASEVIKRAMNYGLMVSINQRLDKESIQVIVDDFGFKVEFQDEDISTIIEDEPDPPETLVKRPPIVTIMGHVDHGKTSLLDYIRNTQVVAGEAGGITQHIGAYKVILPNQQEITFLDTPGHEAFTAMRARGAKVTDIVVLVVAADDSVMPQTIEAINHAQAAGVPIIVAINKIDKPTANPDKIRQQLAERNVLVEEYGGRYQSVEISAKTGKNIDLLLEKILLEAELLDLKANPNRKARGFVIEVKLDKGRGIVGTVLVLKGTLRVNDPFIAGVAYGRVRAMFDERGNRLTEAPPSTPVQILGFDEMPQAGDEFVCVESEKFAKEIATKRMQIKREQEQRATRHITLDDISKGAKLGQRKDLRIIIKGDVDGSIEAISDSLLKLSNEEVQISVIHKGVGAIKESDVLLATASDAIIIGFNVRPSLEARKLAERENIEIRLYDIIYNIINDIKKAIEGMLEPEIFEEVTATVEVREVFKISKVGTIAGCYVKDGKIHRNNKIRVVREGIVIFKGEIESLKHFKDDVREVEANKECGIKIANFNDVKVGDIIEAYKIVEKQRTLENVGKN